MAGDAGSSDRNVRMTCLVAARVEGRRRNACRKGAGEQIIAHSADAGALSGYQRLEQLGGTGLVGEGDMAGGSLSWMI